MEQASYPDNFKFHPWAITNHDATIRFYPRIRRDGSLSTVQYTTNPEEGSQEHAVEVPAFTTESAMSKLGHESIDLMKMNIEGAEYEVLDNLLDSRVFPKQIIVEFHHRFPTIGLDKTRQILARLRGSGYKLIAVSNSGRVLSLLRPTDAGSRQL
ncbi:MAG: FkbM family methyltransferase [Gammaproteobacteria bacterium]|jgi:FkbM family methyltransferase|nr:hypothetical protein [Chromatiales bacterium]MDP6414066.1 FkbM family methyltransferase [Gammaproteobacteria bacterium]MDP6674362.1 FkbM family methyltransferase [Gammaproteobacteria bacterium]